MTVTAGGAADVEESRVAAAVAGVLEGRSA
jgi:hypothetical protein